MHGMDWRFIGSLSSKVSGRHAMVLVGFRQDGAELRFLLQNWWVSKPFVEVSQEYLVAAESRVFFVTTPQTHNAFEATSLDLVEWELVDLPEKAGM